MSFRPAAFASLVFGVLLLAPVPRHAPITTKYRVDTKNETTVDLSGFGQPSQVVNFGLVSWLSVTTRDTTGGRVIDVVVDSMRFEGVVPQLSQATADSAKGGVLHGFVDANSHVKNLTIRPEQNLLLTDIQGTIHGFFPKVRLGAKAGDVWTDTSEVTNTANGADVKSQFVITYTVAGSESVAGASALKINAVTTAGVTGSMNSPAGMVEVEGTVQGKSSFLMSADGRFLGGTSSATSDQLIKSPMAPAPIPLKTSRSVTVTLAP